MSCADEIFGRDEGPFELGGPLRVCARSCDGSGAGAAVRSHRGRGG
jgi:hypothetical protein